MNSKTLRSSLVAGFISLALVAGAAQAADGGRGNDRGGSKYTRQDNSGQRFSEQRGGGERNGRNGARSEQGKYGNDYVRNGSRGNDAGRNESRRQDYSSRSDRRHDYRANDDKRRDDYRRNDQRRQDYRRDDNRRGDYARHDYRRDDGKYRYTYRSNYRPPDYSRYGSRYTYYDTRWHHYGSYPRRGYVTRALPRNVVVVKYRNYNYWYGGGVWYAPRGLSYVVVAPPIGVFVSVLPSYYSTVWFGGLPYYYANDAYYLWRAERRAYEVVEPPPVAQASTATSTTEDIFVYPREGQGDEQVASDRYECHRWAVDETGFDPTRPEGGVPADQVQSARSDYMRAMTACLEGRGYSVT